MASRSPPRDDRRPPVARRYGRAPGCAQPTEPPCLHGTSSVLSTPPMTNPFRFKHIPQIPMEGVQFTLASGMRILVERDTRAPFVGVFTVIGAGASRDPRGKEGLRDVLRELEEGKLAPGELDKVRLSLARQRLLAYTTNASVVEAVLDTKHTGISLGVADQYGIALASVTVEEVEEGFQRCAAGSPTLSLVGEEASTRAAAAAALP